MKKYIILSFAFALFCNGFVWAQHTGRTLFTKDWKFALDSTKGFEKVDAVDNNWRTLNLPHDWSIEGSFSKDHPATAGGGALPGGIGWYRKYFNLPIADSGKEVIIQFDGIYQKSEVWINGHYLGMRPNGYISFQYHLTPYLNYGNKKNVIAVKVNNAQQPNSRWYSGSGIYRNVWLIKTSPIHIDNWGTFISTPQIDKEKATVQVVTQVVNNNSRIIPVILTTTLYNATGKNVGQSSVNIVPDKKYNITQQLEVKAPKLWSVDSPYLYKAVTEIKSGTSVLDRYETPFGIRYFNFDPLKGFSLNGKPLKILGVCNHHDLGALGAAINVRALERQLEILKDMGCNGIRTSHNPPAPELLELCDKMGFIVMDEAFDMWKKSKSPFDYSYSWDDWHRKDLEDMVIRDRNHPSVFIWSIGNEIGEQWGGDKDSSGRVITRELASIVRGLDDTRPITTANNEINSNHLIQSGALDLIGYNYNHNQWSTFHNKYPGKIFISTESTSALETRGQYDKVPMDSIRRWPESWDKPFDKGNKDLSVSAYDHVSTPWGSTHEESWKVLKKFNFLTGMYIWTGFDYLGEPTPYTWPARSSYFGIIDLAGFPKDVYYMYQSEWTSKPVLHILPHWNWKAGDTVDVVAYYNNADDVELFLNGTSLGKRKKVGDDLHVKWRVPFVPGTIKAISKKDGKVVLTKEVKTAGKPARILLEADRKGIKADGNDLSFITVKILDEEGNIVPKADNLVNFTIEGAGFIAGVDNGSPTSHEPFKATLRKAFNGLALAIIQSNGNIGNITVKATSESLQTATIIIDAK